MFDSSASVFSKHKRTLGVLAFLVLYSVGVSFATPPATKYGPGDTLDPACVPGSANCSVQILPVQTGQANKLLSTDGTNTTWTDDLTYTTTGLALNAAGAGIVFTGSGNHDITATSGTLRIGSNTIIGNMEALDSTVDIGTAATRFDKIYANEVNASTIVGTLTGGNLIAETFAINSDNATADTENSFLAFHRGLSSPNGLLGWDALNDEFDLNSTLHITGTIASTNGLTLDGFTNDIITGTNQDLAIMPNGTGNVGIGDNTPLSLFTVGSGDLFQVNSSGAIAAVTGITTTGGYTQSGTGTNIFMGNVGIGDGTPVALLTVGNGDLFQVNASGAIAAVASIATTGGYTQAGTDANTFTGTSTFLNATYSALFTGGNVGIGDSTPAALLTVGSGDLFQVNSSGAIAAVTGITTTGGYTQTGSTANSLSGNTTFTGNVGVGTITSARLTVGNSTTSEQAIHINALDNAVIRFQRAGVSKWGILNNSGTTDGLGFYSYAATTPGLKVVFDKEGNVGLGTATMLSRLTVGADTTANEVISVKSQAYAGIDLIGDSANTAGEPGGTYISFSQDGGTIYGSLGTVNGVAGNLDAKGISLNGALNNYLIMSSAGGMQFGITGATNQVKMTVDANGVGIGDTSPVALFTVGSGDLFQVNSSGAIAAATGITTTGNVTLSTAPTTSAGSYDILTRNSSTGLIEKVASTTFPSGSGTANQVAYFSGTNTITSSTSYVLDNVSGESYFTVTGTTAGAYSRIQRQIGTDKAAVVWMTNVAAADATPVWRAGLISDYNWSLQSLGTSGSYVTRLAMSTSGLAITGTLSVTGTITATDTGGATTLRIGTSSSAGGTDGVAIGNSASAAGAQSTAVGYSSSALGTGGTVVGRSAVAYGNYQTAIGYLAVAGTSGGTEVRSTALGTFATASGTFSAALGGYSGATNTNALAVGVSSASSGVSSIAIGTSSSATHNYAIAIGDTATTTATNQLVVGGNTAYINDVYFGRGVTAASPIAVTINSNGASGTNIAGADLILASGKATGNQTGGSILFQTSTTTTTGATLQSLATKMTLTNGGSLGIGVSPTYKLDVSGTANTTDGYRIAGPATAHGWLLANMGSNMGTALTNNIKRLSADSVWTQDNAALASWRIGMNLGGADNFAVSRSPAGSVTMADLFTVSSGGVATVAGGLTVSTGFSTITVGSTGYVTLNGATSGSAAHALLYTNPTGGSTYVADFNYGGVNDYMSTTYSVRDSHIGSIGIGAAIMGGGTINDFVIQAATTLNLMGGSTVGLKISSTGGAVTIPTTLAVTGTLTTSDIKMSASTWNLYNSSSIALITATSTSSTTNSLAFNYPTTTSASISASTAGYVATFRSGTAGITTTTNGLSIGGFNMDTYNTSIGTLNGWGILTSGWVSTGYPFNGSSSYAGNLIFDQQLAANNPRGLIYYDGDGQNPFNIMKTNWVQMPGKLSVGTTSTTTPTDAIEVTGNGYLSGELKIGSATDLGAYALQVTGNITTTGGYTQSGSSANSFSGSVTAVSDIYAQRGYRQSGTNTFRLENTGASVPVGSTGIGLEGLVSGGIVFLISYDRTNAVYTPVHLRGSTVTIDSGLTNVAVFGGATYASQFNGNSYHGGAAVSGIVSRFENSTGTCDINPTTSTLSCSSDIRLKKNITTLDGESFALKDSYNGVTVLDKILSITPVTYNWNPESDGAAQHIGFIAQELEQVFPSVVSTDPSTGLKSVGYTALIPYTVKAIQEMNVRIAALPAFEDPTLAVKISDFLRGIAERGEALVDSVKTKKVQTEQLCVGNDGDQVCITKDQLQNLLNGSANTASSTTQTSTTTTTDPAPADTTSTTTSTDPAPADTTSTSTPTTTDPAPADTTSTTTSTDPAPAPGV
jgi:trimeric autotransporter adhesin